MRRRIVISALAAGALAAGAPPAAASATATVERVCRPATVLDSPRGLPIGVLYDGTRVLVLRRDRSRRWVRVRASGPIVGWISERALRGC